MVVDPRLYEKVTGRSADPSRRLGEALAKRDRKQSERDALPKGFRGGMRVTRMPGIFAQIFLFWKLKQRDRD